MKLFAGIDVGSSATKCIMLNEKLDVIGSGLVNSGADFESAANAVFEAALSETGQSKSAVSTVVSTGYGRSNVTFAKIKRTEIDCHARGAYHYFPRAITVVDIGGQDNKVIELDDKGLRLHFMMNRKCAAGTGSFLEEMALMLRIPMERLSELASESKDQAVNIGSYCTVFAKTEILSKIRLGVKPEDLARAALESVAKRILETQAFPGEIVATGGVVAHNTIMKKILEGVLKTKVHLPPNPQHIGALGAALIAAENN